jgi:hypothetical protein
MRLIRWVEGRLSGRRSKAAQPCACSPADQDFIFHPSPFRSIRSPVSFAFQQQFEPEAQPHHQHLEHHNQSRGNAQPRLPALSGKDKRLRSHWLSDDDSFERKPTPPPSSSSSLHFDSPAFSSRSIRDKRIDVAHHRRTAPTPLSTPVFRPLPVTPIVSKVTRTASMSSTKSTLDPQVFQSFYSPAHLVHGAILRQKLYEIEVCTRLIPR